MKYLAVSFIVLCSFSCSDGLNNPVPVSNIALCYHKQTDNNEWEIFTNNLSGSKPVNVSNSPSDDEYPEWSPDGKYIVYKHQKLGSNSSVAYVYNLEKDETVALSSDSGGIGEHTPKWLPNGKVFYNYRFYYTDPYLCFIVNPDGSGKRRIRNLEFGSRTYFYQDSYTFLYVQNSRVYKTNIDSTYDKFVLDLQSGNDQIFTIRDFNSIEGKLLINTNTIQGIESAIYEYDIETKQTELIVSAEKGFDLALQRYSKDYSKIVFIESRIGTKEKEYLLSLFENGKKRRLLKLVDQEWFDYNPMEFSNNGKYIAFSKNTGYLAWKSDLYVIDVETTELYYIDGGRQATHPSWNPKF